MKRRIISTVFLLNQKNQVLLQDRTGISRFGEEWALFGGGIDRNETPAKALVREIKEELGFSISQFLFLGRYPDAHCIDFIHVARLNSKQKIKLLEGQGKKWFTIKKARKLKMAGAYQKVFNDLEKHLAAQRPVKLKAVLFDLDGTLIDSIPLHKKSFQLLFSKFGEKLSDAAISNYIRWPTEEIYRKLKVKKKLGLPIETFLRLRREIYWGLVKKKKKLVFEKRVHYLKILKKKYKLKLALVTNSSRQTTERTTPKHVLKLFNCTATFTDVLHGKPAPDLLQLACRKMKVKPSECVMVGDSVVDIIAAEAAGMRAIALSHKHAASSFGELKKTRPLAVVRNEKELEQKIRELDSGSK